MSDKDTRRSRARKRIATSGDHDTEPTALPNDEQEQHVRTRRPGQPQRGNNRARQKAEYPKLLRRDLQYQHPDWSDDKLDKEVDAIVAKLGPRSADGERAVRQIVPEVTVRPSAEVQRDVELAAIMRLPVLIWLRLWLALAWKYGPKAPGKVHRELPTAVGLQMGLGFGLPQVRHWRSQFLKLNPVLAWVHMFPGDRGPGDESNFYKQVKRIFSAAKPATVWAHINRDLVIALAGALVERGVGGGRVRAQFAIVADALTYLMVDAKGFEANIPQRKPVDGEHGELMRGPNRPRADFVSFHRTVGRVRVILLWLFGYRWLEISSLKLQVPLVGTIMPANGSERAYTLKLLERLFQLYPEMKQLDEWYLIGDALYDQSAQFSWTVMQKYGGFLVAPRSGTVSAKEYAWAKSDGVPTCSTCGAYAAFDQAADWPTPRWRINHAVTLAGDWACDATGREVDSARIRWKWSCDCDTDEPAPATYFRENPRLYTYLPHGGTHYRRTLRDVMVAYRNVQESAFALADWSGFGAQDCHRARWAGDEQIDHLGWMMAVGRTARKLVHRNGDYDRLYEEASRLGLLDMATAEQPAGDVADRTPEEVDAMRRAWLDTARVPAGWNDGGFLARLRANAGLPRIGVAVANLQEAPPDSSEDADDEQSEEAA